MEFGATPEGGGAGGNDGGMLGATGGRGGGGPGGMSGGFPFGPDRAIMSSTVGVSLLEEPEDDQNSTKSLSLSGSISLNSPAFITSATFTLFPRRFHITTHPKVPKR